MYNKVVLIGILGKDPEIRDVNGKQLANLSVATWHNRLVDNQWKQDTTWHRVTLWGNAVKSVEKCVKGDTVLVEGEIRHSSYKNKDGFDVQQTDIVGFAKPIRVKQNNYQNTQYGYQNNAQQQPQQVQAQPQQQERVPMSAVNEVGADDLPFN